MAVDQAKVKALVNQIRNSDSRGLFEELLVMMSDDAGIDDIGDHVELEAMLDEAIFGAKDDDEAFARVSEFMDVDVDESYTQRYDLNESTKRIRESSDILEMVQAYLADDDPMILDSIIVQTIEKACEQARTEYSYDMSDAEIDNIADYVEFTVTVGKKRQASAQVIASKITSYLSDEVTEDLQEAVKWTSRRRFDEVTRASYARDYLAQVDDPTAVDYDDYLAWLKDQGVSDQAISKVWFGTNKNRHIASLADKPKSKEPKSSLGKAIAKGGGNATYRQAAKDKKPEAPKKESPFVRDAPLGAKIPDPVPSKNPDPVPAQPTGKMYTLADQKAVADIIRRAGYRLETMWGEDNPVSLRQSKTREGQDIYILDAYIETGDRGPRTDHGGGESGDGWMDSSQIERAFAPYEKKWAPRAEALQKTLQKEGYPTAKVGVDYGEKGHISLTVFIRSQEKKQEAKSRKDSRIQEALKLGDFDDWKVRECLDANSKPLKVGDEVLHSGGQSTITGIKKYRGKDYVDLDGEDIYDHPSTDVELLEEALKPGDLDDDWDEGYGLEDEDEEETWTGEARFGDPTWKPRADFDDEEDQFFDTPILALGFRGPAVDIIAQWYKNEGASPDEVNLADIRDLLNAATNRKEIKIVKAALAERDKDFEDGYLEESRVREAQKFAMGSEEQELQVQRANDSPDWMKPKNGAYMTAAEERAKYGMTSTEMQTDMNSGQGKMRGKHTRADARKALAAAYAAGELPGKRWNTIDGKNVYSMYEDPADIPQEDLEDFFAMRKELGFKETRRNAQGWRKHPDEIDLDDDYDDDDDNFGITGAGYGPMGAPARGASFDDDDDDDDAFDFFGESKMSDLDIEIKELRSQGATDEEIAEALDIDISMLAETKKKPKV